MIFPKDSAFSALPRVFGHSACEHLPQLRICVVGIGGVGSWAVESLARTGVGHITIIDHDDVSESNINRQIHALTSTVGQSKVELMQDRVRLISDACDLDAIDDLLVEKNMDTYLDRHFDVVIDAIDNIRFKAAMIAYCSRNNIPIITTGGAGGRIDPLKVAVADLGFTRNTKKKFGVDCVF